MISGAIRDDLEIARRFVLHVRERVDDDQQADYHYEREYDCESLPHRDLVSGLQRFAIACAKVLPVVRSRLRIAIPVSFETFREFRQWRIKLRTIADRTQIVSVSLVLSETDHIAIAQLNQQRDVAFANRGTHVTVAREGFSFGEKIRCSVFRFKPLTKNNPRFALLAYFHSAARTFETNEQQAHDIGDYQHGRDDDKDLHAATDPARATGFELRRVGKQATKPTNEVLDKPRECIWALRRSGIFRPRQNAFQLLFRGGFGAVGQFRIFKLGNSLVDGTERIQQTFNLPDSLCCGGALQVVERRVKPGVVSVPLQLVCFDLLGLRYPRF